MRISCVIPCYHSQLTIADVVADIHQVMAAHGQQDYEIILVNDNPPDETWDTIQRLRREDARVHGLCFSRNFGQHSALMAGYRQVTGDIVVSLDDDGQNPPAEMFRLIDAVDGKHDVVYADYPRKQHTWFRNLGSRMTNRMFTWMLEKPKELYLASYWAAKRFVIDEMIRCESPFPFVDGLALQTTTRIINVPVDHLPRAEGESGYSVFSLLRLWTNAFTSFSVKPLRIATMVGFVTAFAGLVVGLILVIMKLRGMDFNEGWTSLVALMLFLFGVLMAMLGLVGEYVGRIFISINRRPQYVIEFDTEREAERA
ncbi:MAG: glycosyltransferase family 2 protein [Clostridia bacterium]|nr:glycosyltransferase family 2 protein [Clostridia bacterium]